MDIDSRVKIRDIEVFKIWDIESITWQSKYH